jgi:phospholipid transport system substrate-binding protein
VETAAGCHGDCGKVAGEGFPPGWPGTVAGTGVAANGHMRLTPLVLRSLLALAVTVVASTPVLAGAPTDQLRQHVDQVIKLLDDPALKGKPAERHAKVRKIAEDIFDYPDTARRALGRHWNDRTPQERQEFSQVFSDVLDRAYISKIELYQGEKVTYAGESIEGDEATVKTKIITNKGTEVPVDYRAHLKNGRWLVYDVIIEGVSLVANYRSQFNKIVQTESYAVLLDKLRAKDVEPAASPGPSPRRPAPAR